MTRRRRAEPQGLSRSCRGWSEGVARSFLFLCLSVLISLPLSLCHVLATHLCPSSCSFSDSAFSSYFVPSIPLFILSFPLLQNDFLVSLCQPVLSSLSIQPYIFSTVSPSSPLPVPYHSSLKSPPSSQFLSLDLSSTSPFPPSCGSRSCGLLGPRPVYGLRLSAPMLGGISQCQDSSHYRSLVCTPCLSASQTAGTSFVFD